MSMTVFSSSLRRRRIDRTRSDSFIFILAKHLLVIQTTIFILAANHGGGSVVVDATTTPDMATVWTRGRHNNRSLLVWGTPLWKQSHCDLSMAGLSSFTCDNHHHREEVWSILRGGSEEEEEAEEEDEYKSVEEEEEETGDEVAVAKISSSSLSSKLMSVGKMGILLAVRATVKTALALQRAMSAGLEEVTTSPSNDDEDGTAPSSFIGKTLDILSAMWNAAMNKETTTSSTKSKEKTDTGTSSTSEKDDEEEEDASTTTKTSTHRTRKSADMGDYLAQSYGITQTQDSSSSDNIDYTATPILGGSLSDALRQCRSQARLLVAYLPSSKPNKNSEYDKIAIQSLRSEEVAQAVELKKGSFLIWAAKYNSPEYAQAMKRLQGNTKPNTKKKVPTLVVAYPAQVLDKNTGAPKLSPKLLAQHHCNPPPIPTSLAKFLSALRKRHSKQINTMKIQLREAALLKERTSNYRESLVLDKEREKDEARLKLEAQERKKEEERKKKEMEKQREALRQSLPDEPTSATDTVITIALRFADGRNAQRRFHASDDAIHLFHWIEGYFEWEREKVLVTTMRGDQHLTYADCSTSIQDCGVVAANSKMVALRVSLQKQEEEKEEEEKEMTDKDTK